MNLLETLKGLLSRRIHAGNNYFENIEDNAQVIINPVYQVQRTIDAGPLEEAYLHRMLQTCREIFLSGIDRAAARQGDEACLNLEAVYIALRTRSAAQEFGEEGRRFMRDEQQTRQLSALDQLNRRQRLVLLGDPGSGKSTFVNFVAMCLAGARLGQASINLNLLTHPLPPEQDDEKESPQRQEWQHGPLLPVRIILRDFATEGLPPAGQTANANHLWEFLVKDLKMTPFHEYSKALREHLLKQGGLVLFDGLDEVPEAHARRRQLKEAVEDFARVFPRCRLLVTSRIYAYQQQAWRLNGFEEAVLAPFSNGQIRQFVDNWYAYSASLLGMRPDDAEKRADMLKRAIFSSQRLYDFATRPLLLTLMASLHAWRGGSLPEKRQELYENAVELLLDWWESRKIKAPDGALVSLTERFHLGREGLEALRRLMSKLAYEAHATQPDLEGAANIQEDALAGGLMRLIRANASCQQHDLNPLHLAEYLRDRAGLLVSHGVGLYTFPHRTFQEYLAACYLTYQDDYPENIAELARKDPNRWREVVLLAGAKAAGGAAASIWSLADALCYRDAGDKAMIEDAWGALLAGQALVETARLDQVSARNQPKVAKIRKWLAAILSEQAPAGPPLPAVERALAGNILAQLGDPRPGVGRRTDDLPEIAWCEVPAGMFVMGSDPDKDPNADEDEQPQHEVYLPAYQISRYPVTNAQYQAFVENGGYTERWRQCWTKEGWKAKEENGWNGPRRFGDPFGFPNHPVVGVSWYEAVAFCNWLTLHSRTQGELTDKQSIRLPSEAEWEKAARGADGRTYPWGNAEITPELANYSETGLGATSAVGCFPRGASFYGCEEVAGNEWEWCADAWHENYKGAPTDGRSWEKGGDINLRLLRGGSWGGGPQGLRCAYRSRNNRDNGGDNRGFRVARGVV